MAGAMRKMAVYLGLVEDHGAGPRGRLGGAQEGRGAIGGLAADRAGIERSRPARDLEPEPGLAVVAVVGGDRARGRVAARRLVPAARAGG